MAQTPRQRQVEAVLRDMPLRADGWERRQREGWLAGASTRSYADGIRVRIIVEIDTPNLGVVPLLERIASPVFPGEHAAFIYPENGLWVTAEGAK